MSVAAPAQAEAASAGDAAAGRPAAPTAGEAFRYWLRLGFISFGGPAGQIAIMHHDLVDRKRWISERRFLHALNYCMILPGPEATQLATYIGWMLHRTPGGVVAGTLFVLPSLVVLIALSWLYMAYGDVPAVAGILYGIKPAVVAIVLHAAWRIGSRALRRPTLWAIAAAAFVAIFAFRVPFPAIVLAAGVIGYLGGRIAPGEFAVGGGHGAKSGAHAPAVIDDDTPTPAHARFSGVRLATVLAGCAVLWLVALALLVASYGPGSPLPQMAWFFTKAAFLTFGGAYAVLPYVYQGAVETYAWLTPVQMIDGLALGETTPGPLIMVVAFVGFVGGWTKALFGPDALALAGVAGACVATFFTFLPSFLFILAGGPLVESTHGQIRFTAPLSGITAAVVGVIVNLAAFFAWHVLWPHGWVEGSRLAGLDPASLAIGVAAAVALFRFKAGVIPVILACGAVGLAVRLAGFGP
ncbi:MAG TPA: chromate efflux transporter [Casimicrobiaceae bacterium]|nr:chromate efflux transporter [Casimicrobiaceae bacterium]